VTATATKTGVYVYGVTSASAATPRVTGVGGGTVHAIAHRGLAAISSSVPDGPLRARRRDLMSHADVLQQALAHGQVLPLRFGTVFADADAVVGGFLEPRHDELQGLLRTFDGLAELSLRAYYVEEAVLTEIVRDDARVARLRAARRPADVALGEAVARALAAKRAAEADEIVRTLVPLARDVVVEEPRTEYELVRAAFLVEPRRIDRFDAAVDALARDRAGTAVFKYVGPLPPHSFVDLGGG
jgi:Gas vesicle synthesis protein GvpL/GvpF